MIVIGLKTGDVGLSEEITVNQGAQMFWQTIHEFTLPKPGTTGELLKLDVELPKGVNRVETGSLQINKDWPGIFIRGDNAMLYGLHLKQLLDNPEAFEQDEIAKALLGELSRLLSGCQTSG